MAIENSMVNKAKKPGLISQVFLFSQRTRRGVPVCISRSYIGYFFAIIHLYFGKQKPDQKITNADKEHIRTDHKEYNHQDLHNFTFRTSAGRKIMPKAAFPENRRFPGTAILRVSNKFHIQQP